MNRELEWMLFGVLVLLVLKYAVFGLEAWNAFLHPERREPTDSPFRKPLLGLGGF